MSKWIDVEDRIPVGNRLHFVLAYDDNDSDNDKCFKTTYNFQDTENNRGIVPIYWLANVPESPELECK